MTTISVKYSKRAIGRVRIVDDFLPTPGQLVLREDTVKVTLSLSRCSVDFFKRAAAKQEVPYQHLISEVINAYVEKQEER